MGAHEDSIADDADFLRRTFSLSTDAIIAAGKRNGSVLLVNDRNAMTAHVQKQSLVGGVEVNLIEFLDAVAVTGYFAVGQNRVRKSFAKLRQSVGLLNEN